MLKNKKGFTLIELMVAMGIIAILVTMSIVGIGIVQRSLRNTQRRDALNTINLAINGYYTDFGYFPRTNELRLTATSASINTTKITDLKGPTTPKLVTSNQGSAYCYSSPDGSSYSLGISLEGNDWGLQLGNSGTNCTTAITPQ